MRKLQIAVVGSKNLDMNNEHDKSAWDFSYKLGFALGRTMNIVVIVSGKTGVAEAITKGVNDAGGMSANILPGNYKEEGNELSHFNLACTLPGNEHSWPLIYSADCLIAIGGGTETGIQISLAVDLGLHVVIFSKAGGVSASVFTSLEPTFQKMRSSQLVFLVDDEVEALDRAKQFASDRAKKEKRIEDKSRIELPAHLELISNRNKLAIINALITRKTLSPQELSDLLKIPLAIVQAYLEELDSHEMVLAKKTIAEEHLFSINMDNQFVKKLVDLIVFTQPKEEEDVRE
ncbi:MAG: hypothetical protein KGD59_13700 [Candidatus Heimdallarchaeota archaeon]|nr:hypothetical protein [Candidatus Heimdallarchaeota archaeon]MBY8995599.1 hypothetical protein [Candidatus Heimdallarchaeota archaeon]